MAKKMDLMDRSVEELQAMAKDLDREIFDMRNELSVQRKLEKPHLLKVKRKEKARALTVLTKKQKGIA